MNAEVLLRHFDRISDAPDAVPRLRRFIFDLAVRGKLVDQDPHEEPASVLLEAVEAKKMRMIAADEIRGSKPKSPIKEEELFFAVPSSWLWLRLSEITSYIQRGKSPKYAADDGLPVVSQKCVQWSGLELESAKRITLESIDSYEDYRFLRNDDLLWNSTGTGTIGRLVRISDPPGRLVCDSHVTVVRCLIVRSEYIRIWLRSDHVYGSIEERAAGSTNQVELTSQMANDQIVPVPPLAEQDRIVAKVEELMALCDRLEEAQKDREARQDRLATASLHQLNNGANGKELHESALFFINQLPRLANRSRSIEQMRQTILNLAVRGQIVRQSAKDEPASTLLAKTAAHKAKVGAAKTGRDWVSELVRPVAEAFPAPTGWLWTRISNAVERVTVGYVGPMKQHYVESGIPFLRSQNVRANRFRNDGLINISSQFHRTIAKSALAPGDVVVVRSGNVGTACVIPPSLPEANCSDLVVVKRPSAVLPDYLCFYLNSLAGYHIAEGSVGVALTHFNTKSVATMPLPLPPIAEQHRIVARVHELMKLCDQLEMHLSIAEAERGRLLEAILHEAINPAPVEAQ